MSGYTDPNIIFESNGRVDNALPAENYRVSIVLGPEDPSKDGLYNVPGHVSNAENNTFTWSGWFSYKTLDINRQRGGAFQTTEFELSRVVSKQDTINQDRLKYGTQVKINNGDSVATNGPNEAAKGEPTATGVALHFGYVKSTESLNCITGVPGSDNKLRSPDSSMSQLHDALTVNGANNKDYKGYIHFLR